MTPKLQRTGCFEAHDDVGADGANLPHFFLCADSDAQADICSRPIHFQGIPTSKKHTRVLIIEDNVDAAESLRDLFLLGDHEVEVAYDGVSGIAKAKCFRPDLVMCDIALPGMDGYQVARALREAPSLSCSRLLAWTGCLRPEDLHRCAEAGFHGYMAKPLTTDQLTLLLSYAEDC